MSIWDCQQIPVTWGDFDPKYLMELEMMEENMPLGEEVINNRLGFHQATLEGPNATAPKHRDLRIRFLEFANYLDSIIPDGRNKLLAMTELEAASMWFHKAIAEEAPMVDETKD